MDPFVATLNYIFALGVIVLLVVSLGLLGVYAYERVRRVRTSVGGLVGKFSLFLVFVLTFMAATLSLVYSEIFGFIPCGLCWFARIFMFSQVFVSAGALVMRDKIFAPVYLMTLSVAGMIVTLYHHYIQMGGSEVVACPASSVSCAQRIIFEFGFITFPLLGFSLFAFIFVLLLLQGSHRKELSI